MGLSKRVRKDASLCLFRCLLMCLGKGYGEYAIESFFFFSGRKKKGGGPLVRSVLPLHVPLYGFRTKSIGYEAG